MLRACHSPSVRYIHPAATGSVTLGAGVERVVIACHDFVRLLDSGIPMLTRLNQPPWRRFDLNTGHWPMLSAPTNLVDTLDAAVS